MHEEEFVRHFPIGIEKFLPSPDVPCRLHEETIIFIVIIEFKKAIIIMVDEICQRNGHLDLLLVHHYGETSGINENPQFEEFIVGIFESGHFWDLSHEVVEFLPELTPLFKNSIECRRPFQKS